MVLRIDYATKVNSGDAGKKTEKQKTAKQRELEEDMRRPYFKDMKELAANPRRKYFEAQCFVGREQRMFPGVACAEVTERCQFFSWSFTSCGDQ
jgi:hypothetical protein